MSTAWESATRFADLGYAVFPCIPGRKQPLTARVFLDATTDAKQIEAWWTQHPTANIAIPTTGHTVIYFDGPDNQWLADNPDRLVELATGALAVTRRGGFGFVTKAPTYFSPPNLYAAIATNVSWIGIVSESFREINRVKSVRPLAPLFQRPSAGAMRCR